MSEHSLSIALDNELLMFLHKVKRNIQQSAHKELPDEVLVSIIIEAYREKYSLTKIHELVDTIMPLLTNPPSP